MTDGRGKFNIELNGVTLFDGSLDLSEMSFLHLPLESSQIYTASLNVVVPEELPKVYIAKYNMVYVCVCVYC